MHGHILLRAMHGTNTFDCSSYCAIGIQVNVLELLKSDFCFVSHPLILRNLV